MKKVGAGLLFLVTLALLFYLAQIPAWRNHLFSDLTVFYARTDYFIRHGSFSGITNNEYQPGALIFFSLLSYPLRLHNNLQFFGTLFVTSNVLLLAGMGLVLYRTRGPDNLFFFSLILLFCGPILLFRFETLVVMLTLLAYFQFKNQKLLRGWFWLSLAILTKVYPLFLVPYILARYFARRGFRSTLVQAAVLVLILVVTLSLYSMAFGPSPREIANSVRFHGQKPLHVESIWATIPTLIYWKNHGTPPVRVYDHGIIGLPREVIPNDWRLRYQLASLFCIGVIYVWLIHRALKAPNIDGIFWITILIAITALATILTPQYLLWWALLLPFVEERMAYFSFMLTLAILGLTQYVFPLHYSDLIHGFFVDGRHPKVFWILTLRNILLVWLLYLMGSHIHRLTLSVKQGMETTRRSCN